MKKSNKILHHSGKAFFLFTMLCFIIRILMFIGSFYYNTIHRLINLFN